MSNCFILLAAGQSKRFKSKKPKQYTIYKGKPLYQHSIDKVIKSGLFKHIILVVNNLNYIKKKTSKNVKIITGGKERSDSSYLALKYIKNFKVGNVLIHDAARPNFSISLIKKILRGLKKNRAVIPFINSTDSAKYKLKNNIYNLLRKNTLLTQTPQGFKYKDLFRIAQNKQSLKDSLFLRKEYIANGKVSSTLWDSFNSFAASAGVFSSDNSSTTLSNLFLISLDLANFTIPRINSLSGNLSSGFKLTNFPIA